MNATTRPGSILIVEDDNRMADLIAHYLGNEGFKSIRAQHGEAAVQMIRDQPPELILLDIMLPGMDGWEVCKAIRKFSDVPIIFLSAKTDTIDRVMGLNLGADDYIIKPFSSHELVARIKAVLRRKNQEPRPQKKVLAKGELIVDLEKRSIKLKRKAIDLTPHEYCLLTTLMSYPGKVFTRDELLEKLYPRNQVSVIDKVVDIHIGKLRRKVERDPARPELIIAVRGVGYRFTESEEEN